ncbi:hypothetical protein B0T26DRAFT_831204 [Lasiosphaeria miniovina]|uniref:HNH nuclease domain-containing protein n=1 Tax=Lasiosphaeria miniovina TaxID=1954250 RepID=A0AA40AMP5_9PEZI|nr:uncharacterized protein B0T26DRAFT_831204 [Lasiosphaeria miniovina]KAK0718649.1 hypothetical protein B0T26DRAFT_831204 [Lasiosphaeria miniovina]
MDFEDPLRKFPAITPHPAPDSVASSELSSLLEESDRWYDTRTTVLKILENRYIPNGPDDGTPKVLRAFVMKLLKGGQLALVSETRLLQDDSAKLRQLRNFLVDAILKPMMGTGGKNPKTPITPSPRPNANNDILSSIATIEPSSRNDQRVLKADCLRRDGHRCALTGRVDGKSRGKVPGAAGWMVKTQCAHILPFALRNFDTQSAQEIKPTIWWALYRYFPGLKDLIGPGTINQHQNALTMWDTLHAEFGTFNLAFEPLDDVSVSKIYSTPENRYRTRWVTYPGYEAPDVVTLASNDPPVPLPNSKYFWVHFRIAEILEWFDTGEATLKSIEIGTTSPVLNPVSPDVLRGVGGAVN